MSVSAKRNARSARVKANKNKKEAKKAKYAAMRDGGYNSMLKAKDNRKKNPFAAKNRGPKAPMIVVYDMEPVSRGFLRPRVLLRTSKQAFSAVSMKTFKRSLTRKTLAGFRLPKTRVL